MQTVKPSVCTVPKSHHRNYEGFRRTTQSAIASLTCAIIVKKNNQDFFVNSKQALISKGVI